MTERFDDLQARAKAQWQALAESPRPRILVGIATCGRSAGAMEVLDALREQLARRGLDAVVMEVGCIGMCYAEPIVSILKPGRPGISYGNVTPEKAAQLVERYLEGDDPMPDDALGTVGDGRVDGIPALVETPFFASQVRRTLRNCGVIDPSNVDHYLAQDGYRGLQRALSTTPEEVIDRIKRSGLRGRGGAGFPTWRKWQFCRDAKGDRKYLVSNADEGDPGAFMNRSLLEGDPHALLEGMLIAGYAIGADLGYIYCRAEYPLALDRLRVALGQAEAYGLLGDRILGSELSFRIKIKEGAGAFVCGEETALIASIEGRRGMPRPRPPFPAVSGLWGKPTIINNVETLACTSLILRNGPDWFAQYGTEKSKGTKTFALVGKVKNTGLVEVPLGITLREMIFDIGGGVLDDKPFKAVQTGGPSGGCIPASLLDTPVDYDSLQAAGTIMGSGGMVVMDNETCMVDVARYFLDFAQKESCGECVPCRLGTKQLLGVLEDITSGNGRPEDVDLLAELAQGIKKGALCGLGQTAPNPVLTTIRYFRDEYESHINKQYCASTVCRRLSPAPCQRTCPIGMDVPSYVALIAWGRFREAVDVIHQDNPFPAVCGRICPRPCEDNCTRGETDEPLAIRALKRFVADQMMQDSPPRPARAEVTRSQRVAIIGAGPCGLTAAQGLANLGYAVTVFEARQEPGGMLRHAVPDFRLSKEVVDWETSRIASLVTLRTGRTLGKDFTLGALLSDGYGAVLLAMGASKGMTLSLQTPPRGKDYLDGVKFLTAVKRGRAACPGRRVVVVGSGHVATDAARTAVRLGARRATVLYPRRRKDLPIAQEEFKEATAEGVTFEFGCLPVEIVTKSGRTAAVRCVKTRPGPRDDAGRQRCKPIPGSGFTIPCDAVISAIGHCPDTRCLKDQPGIVRGIFDNVVVDPVTMETGVKGVFAAGDVVSGGTTVIEAIAAGQKAAAAIHRWLNGEPPEARFKLPKPRCRVDLYEVEPELESFKRPPEPVLSAEDRKRGFAEAVGTYPTELAVKEAKRCLRCDLG